MVKEIIDHRNDLMKKMKMEMEMVVKNCQCYCKKTNGTRIFMVYTLTDNRNEVKMLAFGSSFHLRFEHFDVILWSIKV